jgi:hypothetical protein
MTQQHPIVPPPDKIHNWLQLEKIGCDLDQIIIGAAQWGADQELEACIAWFDKRIPGYELVADRLRTARRPKLLSLKEQALIEFDSLLGDSEHEGAAIILRAIEQLPDDQ